MTLRKQQIYGFAGPKQVHDVFKRGREWTGFIRFAGNWVGVRRGMETASWKINPDAAPETPLPAKKLPRRTSGTPKLSAEALELILTQFPKWARARLAPQTKTFYGKVEK